MAGTDTSEAPQPAVDLAPLDPATFVPQLPVPESGDRPGAGGYVYVGSLDGKFEGFVRWEDLHTTAKAVPPPGIEGISKVYDASGRHIAYWGDATGWLSFEQVAAPGFDYGALRAERERDVAEHTRALEEGTPSNAGG